MLNKFVLVLTTFVILTFSQISFGANNNICAANKAESIDLLQWTDPCIYCRVVGCDNTICTNTFCCGNPK